MAAESSDSDFEPPPPARRRLASSRMLSLSQSLRQSSSTTEGETSAGSGSHGSGMAPTARRLNEVVRHGLSIMNSRRHTSVASELANRFPFLSQAASQSGIRFTASSKSRRAATVRKWKITPCLLNSPNSTRVPTRDQMDRLCRQGLGTLWFDKDDQLLLSHHYNAEELHFFLTCLYPPLADKSYQLCRAGGPSHHMIVPLAIEEEEMVPSLERQFRPYFTVDMLKDKIGRKGRLYIRPLSAIDLNSLPTVSAEYAYAPQSSIWCVRCNETLPLLEVGDHLHVCPGERNEESWTTSSHEQAGGVDESGSHRDSGNTPRSETLSAIQLQSGSTANQPAEGGEDEVGGANGRLQRDANTEVDQPDIFAIESEMEAGSISDIELGETLSESRRIREQQDAAYQQSLEIDREREAHQLLQRQIDEENEVDRRISIYEQRDRELRMTEWHRRIRNDLMMTIPDESPEGSQDSIQVRIRYPDGSRTTRRFRLSDPVDALYALVGSHESINPRNFRVLVSDGPIPTELPRGNDTIRQAGLNAFTVLIGENRRDNDEQDEPQESDIIIVPDTPSPISHASSVDPATDHRTNHSPLFVGPSDMETERSRIRRSMIQQGIFRMQVNRCSSIVQQVLVTYANNPALHTQEMMVKFTVEQGHDGGGLRRELVSCFWDEFSKKYMEGSNEKIPILTPMQGVDYYDVGRFISHTYILTGFFPVYLSSAFAKGITCGVGSVTDDELLDSFYNFIDPFEADAIRQCVTASTESVHSIFQHIIIPLLSRFQCNTIPTQDNLQSLLPQVAKFALIVKPFFALSEIRRGMMDAHPAFWQSCGNPSLMHSVYQLLVPTAEKVLAMVSEPQFQTMGQERVFDYLRRFILSLSLDELGKFLRFVTGYAVCGPVHISIQFNNIQGFERRPTANTCSPSLTLSVAYTSYNDFASEFHHLLRSSNLWFFDSI